MRPLCKDCRFFEPVQGLSEHEDINISNLQNLSTCAASLPDVILGKGDIIVVAPLAFNQRFVGTCGLDGALFQPKDETGS